MLKRKMLATLVGATLGVAGWSEARAQADTSDSARVGNLQFGNSLDPTGWSAFLVPDPRGMSWLHPGQLRTPGGVPYPYPNEIPDSDQIGATDWSRFGLVQFGYLAASGDSDNAFFREYADWRNGLALGLAVFSASNARTGAFVEFRGSRISDDDQYYRLRAGRFGSNRFELFHRETLHTLGTTAHPLWEGVGTTELTLPTGISHGSQHEAVREVMAGRPRQTIAVGRDTTGASWEGKATRHWLGQASVSLERRDGERTWGGPMYLTYFYGAPGPGGVGAPAVPGTSGGQYETVRPVDFTTTNIHFGLRNREGALGWLFNFSLDASYFRDHEDHLRFEVPFAVARDSAGIINGGTWSLEPDNDYYNLRIEASHPLDFWDGKFSFVASWASMQQDDPLQAPLDPAFCPDGAFIGSSGIACSDWNTTAALSRESAEARIDTTLVDLRTDFRPTPKLALHARLRRYDEDNKTRYSLFNPLTGQYGYVAENGTVALRIPVPAFMGLFEPGDPEYASVFARVANVPVAYDRLDLELGGTYDLGERNTLGLRYRLERRTPRPRERSRVDEHLVELDWDGRVFDDAKLRVGYEWKRRTGDLYDPNPYLGAFSPLVPGYVPPELGHTAFTVAQMRKYDLGDLESHRLRASLVMPVGEAATLSATLYGHHRDYDAVIGRQSFESFGADASWDWAPSPDTTMSAYAGYQSSELAQGNVNDKESLTFSSPDQADTEFGGPFFPFDQFWSATDEERNVYAGAFLRRVISPRVRFDLGYDFSWSRGVNRYDYASLAAISTVYARILDAASIGDRFPTNLYRTHDLTANLDFKLARDLGLRVFWKYQHGSFVDWHRTGFEVPADLVIGNRVFTELAPPSRWNAMVVGVFITVRL